jgi:hypothetical protein
MSQGIPLPASVPAYAGFTQNSELAASAAGSFDLLWWSDLFIPVLENGSVATSTGAGQSAAFLHAEEPPCLAEPENLSVKTADSSAITAGMKASLHAH